MEFFVRKKNEVGLKWVNAIWGNKDSHRHFSSIGGRGWDTWSREKIYTHLGHDYDVFASP